MENKKYIDKVIDHLVRSTKIDYDNNLISPTFFSSFTFFLLSSSVSFTSRIFLKNSFSSYCENTYGLTEDEIKYVWNEYKDIIKDKLENGEQ